MFGHLIPYDNAPGMRYQSHEWESDLETWLKRQKCVVEQPTEPRWFFSYGSAPGVRGWQGPAKPLGQELRFDSWIEWSQEHPQAAAH
ncbi:MAG: hypothetical protein ACREHD_16825, partial [Pirellulales bacterium]